MHGWADAAKLERRYQAIIDFEATLVNRGITIVKVMLNISPETQKDRLIARLENPTKRWK